MHAHDGGMFSTFADKFVRVLVNPPRGISWQPQVSVTTTMLYAPAPIVQFEAMSKAVGPFERVLLL